MANCRACGGVLGRDCFNEADCLEISRSNQYGNDNDIQYLEYYISVLEYKLIENKLTVPLLNVPENPLVLKPVNLCETNPMYDDGLPF